jgi:hypothetical protein
MADLTGMMQAAAGGAGGGVLVEDVFSTTLYTGNATARTITNDLDLSGEGGLVWIKARTAASNNYVFDTTRGALEAMYTDATLASGAVAGTLTSFNSDGFSLGTQGDVNGNGTTYVSWSFRKAPKFFDCVTYTGTGSTRTVSHNLGSVPGMIIVKGTDFSDGWRVYHRSLGASKYLTLSATDAENTNNAYFGGVSPTSTQFTVGSDFSVNGNTKSFIAYLFAHDDGGFGPSGADNGITCGSYTGNGSATGPTVTLGYEPQWLMIKRSSSTGDWIILDSKRDVSNPRDKYLEPNTSDAEATGNDVDFNSTSFQLKTTSATVNANSGTYIYIAISEPI